ncbi:alpha-amylase family glycosyl hydrolase [Phaeodactylibacter sp.]|jgi:glycosidase|uniref:alpha-amylase family glycosyl hydrolase n=1 Tax=Phaeodactylibacter sp. TaxID=1940289 RepID=UPI0025E11612|nr:alpha-amylase family glycosyl hydrolase [Phaeodactylibacter sp.]MCI4648114.1 alpha-amylase family glycosyl hydrolase [Phaeodactylibacter sp.]MCI5090582.1 alpha-amylase family glycosyl hydrolase [Phaeodactylibacter sp.]
MRSLFFLLTVLSLSACGGGEGTEAENPSEPMEQPDLLPSAATPEWAAQANIYEVNVRQYTPSGTLEAFAKHLPRLKEMGVDILWFMPVYPISEARRKGSLGSYYAVADYTAVNPAFGTMEEFKALVNQIHDMDMRVILDWVPNHTGWDHPWITEHPEYYTQDSLGNVIDPIDPKTGESWGWTDVADLNYDNAALREAMIGEMLFWLEEVGIDGYRCDVAGEVPDDFWAQAVPRLRAANPELFMLAESDHPPHRNEEWFAMNYGWEFHHLMNAIAKGEQSPLAIDTVLAKKAAVYNRGYFMNFLTNHDENSWQGTIEERMGPAADAMAVLAFTIDGMPLMYSGQEAGLNHRLKFFEKDTIPWNGFKKTRFYKTLLDLKHNNPALGNGLAGGVLERITVENATEEIYAYRRKKGANQVVVLLNLSGEPQSFTLSQEDLAGEYTNVFANSTVKLTPEMSMNLNPWSYLLLEQ